MKYMTPIYISHILLSTYLINRLMIIKRIEHAFGFPGTFKRQVVMLHIIIFVLHVFSLFAKVYIRWLVMGAMQVIHLTYLYSKIVYFILYMSNMSNTNYANVFIILKPWKLCLFVLYLGFLSFVLFMQSVLTQSIF